MGARGRAAAVAPAGVFAVAFAVLLWGGLRDGHGELGELLRGPDDFMRMTRVLDWLDGQAWHDPFAHRLNPPDGVAMHWSRLSDLPVAGVIAVAEPWLGRDRAALAAATLAPALLGGAFVAAFFWAAAPLAAGRRCAAPLLAAAALIAPLSQFAPGRIDHHGLQLLLLALMAGWLLRALPDASPGAPPGRGRSARAAAAAAGLAALSLAVGLETLPATGAMAAALGLGWAWRRVDGAAVAAFGATLAVAAFALLPIAVPAAERFAGTCDRMSIVYCAMAAVAAAAGGVAVAAERIGRPTSAAVRLALLFGVAVSGLALVAGVFPRCAGGPLSGLDPEVRYWFDRVSEARSLAELFADTPGTAVAYALLPALGLAFAGWRLWPAPWREPRLAAAAVLLAATAGTMAWQVRGAGGAGLTTALVLTPLAATVDLRARRLRPLAARVLMRLGLPAAMAMTIYGPVAAVRAVADAQPERDAACDLGPVLGALTDPAGLGARPRNVAAPIDLGPRVLLQTRHRVLAAPYHRNVRGLVDNRAIFTGDPARAFGVVRRRSVEAVMYCGPSGGAAGGDLTTLGGLLAADRPPAWLERVAAGEGIRLYRVLEGEFDGGA